MISKVLGLLSISVLLLAQVQASSILEEGYNLAKRGLEQTGVTANAVPTTTPVVPPVVAPPPPARIVAPPPSRFFAPPPTQVTNRALLYNSPIRLAPGEYLVYRPSNMFDLVGAPPTINLPAVERVFDNEAPVRSLTPDQQTIFTELGPAVSQVPKPAQQSFINLLTPDIKSIPAVSQAISQAGLAANPSQTTTTSNPPPPSSSSYGVSQYKVALSLIALFVSLFVILF